MIEDCPDCGRPGKLLIYGLPGPELRQAADDGWVGLGGCMIEDDQPDWVCPSGHAWPDRDLDGRIRLLDEILTRYDTPAASDEESPEVLSPDGKWAVTFVADDFRVRGTGEHFTDLFDKGSDVRVTLDWAVLHARHLPDGTEHRTGIGVEMPVSAYPHEYMDWGTERAVRFSADDVVVLRMPWDSEVAVPLPPPPAITADRPERA